MIKHIAASLAFVVAACGAAVAQPVPAYNWTGFYAGAFGGYAWGSVSGGPGAFSNTTDIKDDGTMAGLQGGYRRQFMNNVVFGAELILPLYITKGTSRDITNPAITYEAKPNWAVFGDLQLGYAYGRFLPYVFVGGGWTNVTGTTFNVSPAGVFALGQSDSANATHRVLIAGAGLNYAVTDNIALGLRYTYIDLSKENYEMAWNAPPPNPFWWRASMLFVTAEYRF